MKKKSNLIPLDSVNLLTKVDPSMWDKLIDEDGDISSILCKSYADEHYPNTAGMIYALALWRQHKVIYEFDGEIAKMLKDMGEVEDSIPCEAIVHLPYNGIYIQLPSKVFGYVNKERDFADHVKEEIHVEGFFFSIDTKISTVAQKAFNIKEDIFSLATFDMFFDNKMMMSLAIPLSENYTIKTGFEYMNSAHVGNESMVRMCNELLQLVLYLSSVNADIEEDTEQKEIRERAEKKTEQERTQEKTSETTTESKVSYRDLRKWNIGFRYGAAVKKARQAERKSRSTDDTTQGSTARQGSHSRKRTHARRGHFHHFWTGNRKGERKLILKWVSPVIVNAEYENIVTIHKVK